MSKTKITCLQFILFIFVFVQVSQAQPFTWTTPVNISNVSWYFCNSPTMCMDKNGNIYVVWRYPSHGSDMDLFFSWYDGQIWHPAEKIYDDDHQIYNPHLVADTRGDLHLCFERFYADFARVFYMKRENGIWQSALQLSVDTLGGGYENALVIDSRNHIHVFWRDINMFTTSYDSQSWAPIQKTTNLQADYEALHPSAAVDSNNIIHLIFLIATPSLHNRQIYYQKFDGSFWSPPDNISRNDSLEALRSDITINRQNEPLVTWQQLMQPLGSFYEIFYSTYSNNDWTVPQNISNLNNYTGPPKIRILKNGTPISFFESGGQLYYSFLNGSQWQTNQWELNLSVGVYFDLAIDQQNHLHLVVAGNSTLHIGDIYYTEGSVTTGMHPITGSVPNDIHVYAPYPNPFNSEVVTSISVERTMHVGLKVYDLIGKEVINLIHSKTYLPGVYQIRWNGTNQNGKEVSSGIYYLVFKAKGQIISRKILLIR